MTFTIHTISTRLDEEIQSKINSKTKPLGALGILENIAYQIARIQQTLQPRLNQPTVAIFAGDHGIAKTGLVSPYPQEVTFQMVKNFLNGGAAINVLARQNGLKVKVIDAGVNYEFGNTAGLIDAKIAYGTANYLMDSAMTYQQCETALTKGSEIVKDIQEAGSNIIGFGEMGIGNTSSAALLMSVACQLPIRQCVGKGSGVDAKQLVRKINILEQVALKHKDLNLEDPVAILSTFGGFEIAQMCGGMLQAAALGMIILVDGFISSAALMMAQMLNKKVLDYCLFTHHSNEQGHGEMLAALGVRPLLNLQMRLGEGTGCAVAYPIIQAACTFFNDMASFQEAAISQKQ